MLSLFYAIDRETRMRDIAKDDALESNFRDTTSPLVGKMVIGPENVFGAFLSHFLPLRIFVVYAKLFARPRHSKLAHFFDTFFHTLFNSVASITV